MAKKKEIPEDFVSRKLRAINEMPNERKAKYLAERIMRIARSKQNEEV